MSASFEKTFSSDASSTRSHSPNTPLMSNRVSPEHLPSLSVYESRRGQHQQQRQQSFQSAKTHSPILHEMFLFSNRKRKVLSPISVSSGTAVLGGWKAPSKFHRRSGSPIVVEGDSSSSSSSGNDERTTTTSNNNRSCSDRFQSVLERPFVFWREMDQLFSQLFSEWSTYQRGRMIHHLIHFLELKIGLNEYIPQGLLMATPVVDKAWRGLVLESVLYQKVIKHIQDFHGQPRRMIHYSIFQSFDAITNTTAGDDDDEDSLTAASTTAVTNSQRAVQEAEDKLRRTQSLFQVYYLETMPMVIEEEETPIPMHLSQPSLISVDDGGDELMGCTESPSFQNRSTTTLPRPSTRMTPPAPLSRPITGRRNTNNPRRSSGRYSSGGISGSRVGGGISLPRRRQQQQPPPPPPSSSSSTARTTSVRDDDPKVSAYPLPPILRNPQPQPPASNVGYASGSDTDDASLNSLNSIASSLYGETFLDEVVELD